MGSVKNIDLVKWAVVIGLVRGRLDCRPSKSPWVRSRSRSRCPEPARVLAPHVGWVEDDFEHKSRFRAAAKLGKDSHVKRGISLEEIGKILESHEPFRFRVREFIGLVEKLQPAGGDRVRRRT